MCHTGSETISHLFFSPITRQYWTSNNIRQQIWPNIHADIEQCLNSLCHRPKSTQFVSYNLWSIWREHNSIVFEKSTMNIDHIYIIEPDICNRNGPWQIFLSLSSHVILMYP